MGRIGISITKSTSFRGVQQEFSNVYYYEDPTQLIKLGQSAAEALIDEVVAAEKPWHANNVTYVRGRCWWQTSNKADTEMLATKALSGTGTITPDNTMDKERAFLFRLRAGSDSRGNPVYLRKWYHVGCWFNSSTSISGLLPQTSSMTTTERQTRAALVDAIRKIGTADEWTLCSKNGRSINVGAGFECHKYLEHHQLGDAWRAV